MSNENEKHVIASVIPSIVGPSPTARAEAPKLPRQPLSNLTLLFDVDTVNTLPAFFAIQCLLWRTLGATVVLLAKDEAIGVDAAKKGDIGFSRLGFPGRAVTLSWNAWKHKTAMESLARGQVVWIDLAFAAWPKEEPGVDNIPGLTILNWGAILKTGTRPTILTRS